MKISEILIAKILIVGVILSALVVLFGGSLFLMHHAFDPHVNPLFSSTHYIFSFVDTIQGIFEFNPNSFVLLGFFILLLTQVVRVFLTGLYFIERKEKFYSWISFFILAVLIYSLWTSI